MVASVDPYLIDWLDLVFRWFHVITAIVWIGTSFYFVALDNHLRPAADKPDLSGDTWEIHGGGFYRVEKYRVAPPVLPEPLHWYKWEAYWTWISGFVLFTVLYYLQPHTYLIDPEVADLSAAAAIGISIGLLVVGWIVYDALCRTVARRSEAAMAVCMLALVTLAAWGVTNLFAGRAAYLQVGAMLGTIMVANVFFVIIPAHWELIRAKEAGREPDPAANFRGKQRSVHNSYLTLPVLFAMLSNHFSFTYGHSYSWAILVCLMVIGAWVRHYFIMRHAGRTLWWIPVTAALAVAGLAVWMRPAEESAASAATVSFERARAIVTERCAGCHSAQPTLVSAPPQGIAFDTPEQIQSNAQLILQQAVVLKTMPLGNVTHMTPAERATLGAWISQGAKIP